MRARQDESLKIPPAEHPPPLQTLDLSPARPRALCPLLGGCPPVSPSPSEGSAINTHLSVPHASRGAYFQQLASFPNLPLPICCYQASSLLILLNFCLFPLGRLRHDCSSSHTPKHLLLSALGWFLPLSSCRSEICCFLPGERDHIPKASIEECGSCESFFMASPSRKLVVISLSFQMAM